MARAAAAVAVLVLVIAAAVQAAPAAQKITSLPGLSTPINFTQYAGYINVDAKSNRNLFYWFVESQRNPAKDPLLLWMNGGPGARSPVPSMPSEPRSPAPLLSLCYRLHVL